MTLSMAPSASFRLRHRGWKAKLMRNCPIHQHPPTSFGLRNLPRDVATVQPGPPPILTETLDLPHPMTAARGWLRPGDRRVRRTTPSPSTQTPSSTVRDGPTAASGRGRQQHQQRRPIASGKRSLTTHEERESPANDCTNYSCG